MEKGFKIQKTFPVIICPSLNRLNIVFQQPNSELGKRKKEIEKYSQASKQDVLKLLRRS